MVNPCNVFFSQIFFCKSDFQSYDMLLQGLMPFENSLYVFLIIIIIIYYHLVLLKRYVSCMFSHQRTVALFRNFSCWCKAWPRRWGMERRDTASYRSRLTASRPCWRPRKLSMKRRRTCTSKMWVELCRLCGFVIKDTWSVATLI